MSGKRRARQCLWSHGDWSRLASCAVTARNPKAYEDGRAVRAAVKALMEARSPLLPPLTAKLINAKLPAHLQRDENTVRWHPKGIANRLLEIASHERIVGRSSK